MTPKGRHVRNSEWPHVPHGVFVEEPQEVVEATVVPALKSASCEVGVSGAIHAESLRAGTCRRARTFTHPRIGAKLSSLTYLRRAAPVARVDLLRPIENAVFGERGAQGSQQ